MYSKYLWSCNAWLTASSNIILTIPNCNEMNQRTLCTSHTSLHGLLQFAEFEVDRVVVVDIVISEAIAHDCTCRGRLSSLSQLTDSQLFTTLEFPLFLHKLLLSLLNCFHHWMLLLLTTLFSVFTLKWNKSRSINNSGDYHRDSRAWHLLLSTRVQFNDPQ